MVLPPPPGARKVRKQLSADALYALVGESFAKIPDHRQPGAPIDLRDALLSAFAMFSLKDPSLLAFDHRRSDANLKALSIPRASPQQGRVNAHAVAREPALQDNPSSRPSLCHHDSRCSSRLTRRRGHLAAPKRPHAGNC